jgi:CDP-diacylglycerol pyrophosphatase
MKARTSVQRLLIAMIPLVLFTAQPARADRMTLWNIVALKCLRHFAKAEAPTPCESVDISQGEDRGVALLKDVVGAAQMLAIPTRRVTGIEDPALLAPDAPNYFAAAWEGRVRVEAHLRRRLPREAVGVTVDSMVARSQDQLHLRIDCVDKDAAAALRDYQGPLDEQWRVMTVELKGRRYWARRLDSSGLADASPFRLLAEGVAGAKQEMGQWSLAAIGANFAGKPGFVLLADRAEQAVGGHAEDLQDHACAIAAPAL